MLDFSHRSHCASADKPLIRNYNNKSLFGSLKATIETCRLIQQNWLMLAEERGPTECLRY